MAFTCDICSAFLCQIIDRLINLLKSFQNCKQGWFSVVVEKQLYTLIFTLLLKTHEIYMILKLLCFAVVSGSTTNYCSGIKSKVFIGGISIAKKF